MEVASEDSIVLDSSPDLVQAELWRGVLEAEGIAATIRERNSLGAAIGLYTGATGSMHDLVVSETDRETARALLDAYESGRGEVSEQELADAAEEMFDERV